MDNEVYIFPLTEEQVDEGLKENIISLAFGASLLAMPNILDAKDVVSAQRARPATISRTQTSTVVNIQQLARIAAKDQTKTYGGYSQLEAANILAKTIFYEGRSEGHEGRHYIATVIYNRSNKNLQNIVSVCFKPAAFSCWNSKAPLKNPGKYGPGKLKISAPRESLFNSAEKDAWEDSKKIASEIFNGTFKKDGNYNAYYAWKKVTPSWSSKLQNATSLNNHKFGYLTSEDPALKKTKPSKKPNGIYVVQTGDNGISYIAKKLLKNGMYGGKSVDELTDLIKAANGFNDKNPIIKVGQKIILPT